MYCVIMYVCTYTRFAYGTPVDSGAFSGYLMVPFMLTACPQPVIQMIDMCMKPHFSLLLPFSPALLSGEYRRDLWKLNGTVEGSQSFPSQCSRTWFSYAHLHGLLMGLPWGLLLPLGFFIARYYRTKGPLWFILHIVLQVSASLRRKCCTKGCVCVRVCVCVCVCVIIHVHIYVMSYFICAESVQCGWGLLRMCVH